MMWLLLIPAAVLALAFGAGVCVGLTFLALIPCARRLLERQAVELEEQARAVQRWHEVLAACRPASSSSTWRGNA